MWSFVKLIPKKSWKWFHTVRLWFFSGIETVWLFFHTFGALGSAGISITWWHSRISRLISPLRFFVAFIFRRWPVEFFAWERFTLPTVLPLKLVGCFCLWTDCSFSTFRFLTFQAFLLFSGPDGPPYNFPAWQVPALFFLNWGVVGFP